MRPLRQSSAPIVYERIDAQDKCGYLARRIQKAVRVTGSCSIPQPLGFGRGGRGLWGPGEHVFDWP